MKLEKFDEEVGPYLEEISYCSGWTIYFVEKLQKAVEDLKAVPEFKTQASKELDKAISQVEERLSEMKASAKKLSEKNIAR